MSLHINWVGHACFKLVTPELTVITDPLDKATGYNPPRTSADVVLVSSSNDHHSNTDVVKEEPIVFDGPGEYEVKGSLIHGIPSKGPKDHPSNTIYVFRMEGIRLCHLGALSEKLSDQQLEAIGNIDVLFLPAGIPDALSYKHAAEMMNAIDPRIVIPYGYKTDKSALKGVEAPKVFLKEMGMTGAETAPKAVLKATQLPTDETKIMLLEAQG